MGVPLSIQQETDMTHKYVGDDVRIRLSGKGAGWVIEPQIHADAPSAQNSRISFFLAASPVGLLS